MTLDLTAFSWRGQAPDWQMTDQTITITSRPHTDLWQRTYYHFQNDNAPLLMMTSQETYFSFSFKVTFDSKHRFDQAGLVLYLDSDNWLKAASEYENEDFQHLGSVVTNGGYSDWATAAIPSHHRTIYYRLSRRGQDFRIESSFDGQNFSQMRICHMAAAKASINFGIYAASPEDSSFDAIFSDFQLGPCLWQAHDGQAPD